MPSYQDLEVRTCVLEDKIDFLLRAIPITLVRKSAVADADGNFASIPTKSNMLELYRLQRAGVGHTELLPLTPPTEEKPNADVL